MTIQSAIRKAKLIKPDRYHTYMKILDRLCIIDKQLSHMYTNPLKYSIRISQLESQKVILNNA